MGGKIFTGKLKCKQNQSNTFHNMRPEMDTYTTPLEDGDSGQAKKRSSLKYRDNPTFHDILIAETMG
jgi:hypothetical protein